MKTITVLQRPFQLKQDGTIPIVIRVTEKGKSKYIPVGYSVAPKFFREGLSGWVFKHPDSIFINEKIEQKRKDILEGKTSSSSSLTILQLILKKQSIHEQRNQAAIYSKLNDLKKNLSPYNIPVSEISSEWLNEYIAHRLKKVKVITLKKDLSLLRGCLDKFKFSTEVIDEAQPELVAVRNNKEKLTKEDIVKLEQAKLTGLEDLSRDMFLFSFYTHGMRFENVATFVYKPGPVFYQMNKGQAFRQIELHPKLAAIIEKYKTNKPYLFPLVTEPKITPWNKKKVIGPANALMNKYIKKVAFLLDLDKKISMHVSRHTFAHQTLERGVDHSVIKDALGHSSIKTTEGYLKSLSDSKINKDVNGLYD